MTEINIFYWCIKQKTWIKSKKYVAFGHKLGKLVSNLKMNITKMSMFGGAYGDTRMPNWPHRHRTPLPGIATSVLRHDKERALWGRQHFCPHFSSATKVCGWCDYTLPLFSTLGLGRKFAAGCLRSRPAWIVFLCFHCWVADGKHMGCEVWH